MEPSPGEGVSSFASEVPPGSQANGALPISADGAERAPSGAAGASAGTAVPPSDDVGGNTAQRAIMEADILQRHGDRLYALSQFSGLSIIDISNPAALTLEGVYRSAATPFEMYVDDGLVLAMFNDWSAYVCDDQLGSCSWQNTSRIQAIDARDPRSIQLLSDYEVPGTISDSRRVGDVLYLATVEWNGCWGCDSRPNTSVTSFDVADPTRLAQVDQLRFPAADDTYIGQRSISVTTDRIYISGWEWTSNSATQTGSIQVVDISDAAGALVAGARVPIAGQVQSRWQMDEYDGILRVISQPGGWGGSIPPVVETFQVHSAEDIERLAQLSIRLPRPNEVLQSVRFDGERAYAITFEQTDPLFTFDLSDPRAPQQIGELEMPGWVYHMEPRGDRLLGLGFDNTSQVGALNVSLFDVSDLSQPTLLSRAEFGGDWGNFAEDQDRIHKAFTILEEEGLILVPFSGGQHDEASCRYEYGSGIQLVDYTRDTLTRRGVAPQRGTARRAFMHREHLFGIGDNAVQTFDISDRDAPVSSGTLDVARNVTTVRVIEDHLLRFGSDWWTNQTILDLTPLAKAGEAQPGAEIDLSALFGEDAWSCQGSTQWTGQVFTRGNYAYVPRYNYTYTQSYTSWEQRLTFYVVDLTNPSVPQALGSFSVEPARNQNYFAGIIQTDNTLLVGRTSGTFRYQNGQFVERPRYYYDIIDLTRAEAPVVASRFEVPELIAGGGWGYSVGGCSMDMPWGWSMNRGYAPSVALTDGDLVISQHAEVVEGSELVRYYLDRIDVSDPQNPVLLPKVNIPGNVLRFRAATGELVTLDYQSAREAANGWEDCYARGAYGLFDEQKRTCQVFRRAINALVLDDEQAVLKSRVLLDRTSLTNNIAVSDTRIFFTTTPLSSSAATTNGDSQMPPVTLEALRLNNGVFERLPPVDLGRGQPRWWGGQLLARGDRAFEISQNTLRVVDTHDVNDPASLTHLLPGWDCSALEVQGDTAYCALGQRGVEVIDLSSLR